MDKMQAVFRTEAKELVLALESSLLVFEQDLTSVNAVQEIFRVMHTLKGSASMFGFESLSALTHDLETIYDEIRNGKTAPTDEILEVTLECVDHLKELISDPELIAPGMKEHHQYFLSKIKNLLSGANNSVKVLTPRNESLCTYYVSCKPGQEIFANGTNPLFLIDDLANLGRIFALPVLDAIPAIDTIDPSKCYVYFEVILVCSRPVSDIQDVFIFVEDSCTIVIEKIGDHDLLDNKRFIDTISGEIAYPPRPAFGVEMIKTLAASMVTYKPTGGTKEKAASKNDATTIRVSSDKLDELMNLVSELVTSQARLTLLTEQHGVNDLMGLAEQMDKLTRRLRDNAFNICLVPIETLVIRFQRLVRDLSKDLNKNIEFVAEGTDTELDRSIIEKITDPILHILRNCLDHGIETPAVRFEAGKPEVGTIRLKASHAGTNVIIQISDDGKGIDKQVIRAKAIEKGIIDAHADLTDSEIMNLVFAAGFSTAAEVTDVSGRGVGMDIVKRNIEGLHGEVSIESEKGVGTKLTIKLPLTLSILDGMLVRIGDFTYLLPLSAIRTCYEIHSTKISSDIAQKHAFDGELLPVFNLQSVFKCRPHTDRMMHVIKIGYDEFPVGISVDNIIGEYQAVMKPLGDLYKGHDEFSGATILGDGTVALVLDTTTLVRQLIKQENSLVLNN